MTSSPMIYSFASKEQEDFFQTFIHTEYIESDPAGGVSNISQPYITVGFYDNNNNNNKPLEFGLDTAAPSPPWSESDLGTGRTTSPVLDGSMASLSDGEGNDSEYSNGSEGMEGIDDNYFQFGIIDPSSTSVDDVDFRLDIAAANLNFSNLIQNFQFDILSNHHHQQQQQQEQQQQQQFLDYSQQAPLTPPGGYPTSKMSPASTNPDEPKRKRGRKKRDPPSVINSSHPAPLKPLMPNLSVQPILSQQKHVKLELPPSPPLNPTISPKSNGDQLKKKPTLAPAPSLPDQSIQIIKPESQHNSGLQTIAQKQTHIMPSLSASGNAPSTTQAPPDPLLTAHQKRQERLIKNRAAALLSRKRKREHITLLELEKTELTIRVSGLEQECGSLQEENSRLLKENEELKRRNIGLDKYPFEDPISRHIIIPPPVKAGNNRSTGVFLMIILFSFALFTLPATNTNQLNVGGIPNMSIRRVYQQSLLPATPSSLNVPVTSPSVHKPEAVLNAKNKNADVTNFLPSSSTMQEKGLVQTTTYPFSTLEEAYDHAYFYCDSFKPIVPHEGLDSSKDIVMPEEPLIMDYINTSKGTKRPRMSIFSPANETSTLPFDSNDDDSSEKEFVQIDVEVISSRFVSSTVVNPSTKDSFSFIPHLPAFSNPATDNVYIKEEPDEDWVVMKKLRMTINATDLKEEELDRRVKRRKERKEKRGRVLMRL